MIFRVLFFIVFSFLSFNVSAAYYWTLNGTQYSSPEQACTVLLTGYTEIGWKNIIFDHYGGLSSSNDPDVDGYGFCFYSATNKWDETTIRRHATMISRAGTPDPEHVDSCANAPSAIISRGPYGPVIESGGNRYVMSPSPESVCSGNCLYEKPETSNTKDCFALADDSQTGFCNHGFTLVTSDTGAGTSCEVNTVIPYETGASLNGSGSGGDDGSGGDGSGGNGSGSGGNGSGSDGDGTGGDGSGSGGDGSGSFDPPGSADLDYRDEERVTKAKLAASDLKSTFDQSKTAVAVNSAFSDMAEPAGVCPTPTFELFGESITMDSHCLLFAQVEPVISFVTTACWLLLAAIIILSA